tara:strand:- start:270 stop:488 length:219 start_codon:yes stop_codon:yes gene_type:complete
MSNIINIRFPVPPVWWITWSDDTETTVLGYGYVASSEVLSTIQHITTYLDEAVWKSVLLQHGIDPDPDKEEE